MCRPCVVADVLVSLADHGAASGPSRRPVCTGQPTAARPMRTRIGKHCGRYVEEAPSARPTIQKQIPAVKDKSFFTMASGGLGYGLPAAVGCAIADPTRKLVCVIGDGSMMYSIQALWTAAPLNAPLMVIVLNNSRYGAMYSFSKLMGYKDAPGLDLPGIDFVPLSESQGVQAWRVDSPENRHGTLELALNSSKPTLVEIVVDPNQGDVY